jgi:hypothetical protein
MKTAPTLLVKSSDEIQVLNPEKFDKVQPSLFLLTG